MAYTPINWQTGDTITAEKMNKMDNGWGMQNTEVVNETVTTAEESGMNSAQLDYSSIINADTITVIFDGTEYTCQRNDRVDGFFYGGISDQGPVFTDYPFALSSVKADDITIFNTLYTETASTHTIIVSYSTMQTTMDFSEAVAAVIDLNTLPFRCVEGVTTYDEARSAINGGRLVYFNAKEEPSQVTLRCFIINRVASTCVIVPTSNNIEAKFDKNTNLFYISSQSNI